MAWIESHQSLGTHLKLRRLARELRVHRATAIGHLHFLWWWALDNAPTGDLSALSSAEIAEAADWPGHEDQFAAAMKAHGWLDPDGKIHDWAEYAGRLIERREADRERKRNLRRKDVQRTSSGHPQEVPGTSAGQAEDVPGMSCVPNPTQPNQPEESVCAPPAEPVLPPLSRTEFDALAALRGIPPECAEWVWDVHDARGWTDTTGQIIRNVEPVLRRGLVRWQERNAKAVASNRPLQRPAPAKPDWNDPKANQF